MCGHPEAVALATLKAHPDAAREKDRKSGGVSCTGQVLVAQGVAFLSMKPSGEKSRVVDFVR